MSLLSPALEAFMAICQFKTVHAAADALFLTQTAVTQRLRTLEQQLKVTLFIRSRRGMLLTKEGEALLRYCKGAQALEGEAFAHIKQSGVETASFVKISGPSSIMVSRIVPQTTAILGDFPQLFLQFDIHDGADDYLLDSLRNGRSDFIVITPEQIGKEVKSKILDPEHYVLVCSPLWKKRKLRDIIEHETIIDFNPSDRLTFAYLKAYDLFSQAKHHRHFANHTNMLAQMIIDGIGYGVLTKEFSQPYIERGRLHILNQGKVYENQLVLAWYDRPEPSRYFEALINKIS